MLYACKCIILCHNQSILKTVFTVSRLGKDEVAKLQQIDIR